MNRYRHTANASGKHAAQRPDLQRVRMNAAESPYPTSPRNTREAQQFADEQQRTAAIAGRHAAADDPQATQAIPGQQPTQAMPGARLGRHGRNGVAAGQAPADAQATQVMPGARRGRGNAAATGEASSQPTQAMPGRRRSAADVRAEAGANAQASRPIAGQQPTAALPADETAKMGRGRRGRRARADKPRRKSFVTRQVEAWCSRVLGAVGEGGLAEQEAEYASGRTTRDFVWNTIGVGLWGMVFPVLTIVVTQLAGAEQAGMFSLAFVTALLLMFLGNYGIRNFQASDLEEEYSFADYQVNRVVTVVIMLLAGMAYCNFRGYTDQMWLMSLGVYLYKAVDALADVYEGRLQQMDKLYLAGASQAFRSAVALVGFSLVLLVTRNVGASSIAMAVFAAATFIVFTFPLAKLETPKSRRVNGKRVVQLLKQCFPLFVALFMYNLIDNMPKFVMEGALSYDNQLYYNALYFPAHAILLTSGFIYKPMLLKMANAWADPAKRKKFDLIIFVMFAVIVAITAAMAGIMSWFGLSVMSFLYGIDFSEYRGLCFVMLAAGGVTAGIEFLYQVITVLRRQRAVTKLYLITFGFSLFVPVLLVNFTGLPGAVIGYLIVMCILLVLLVSEYASIRMDLHRKLTGKAAPDAEMPRAARAAGTAPTAGAAASAQAAGQPMAGGAPAANAAQPTENAQVGRVTPAAPTTGTATPAAAASLATPAPSATAPVATAPTTPTAATQEAAQEPPQAAPARDGFSTMPAAAYSDTPISWSAGESVSLAQAEPESPRSEQ